MNGVEVSVMAWSSTVVNPLHVHICLVHEEKQFNHIVLCWFGFGFG